MHDDLLERRLRSALHEEAGRLSFTITAAELERRAVLRGRVGTGNRRLTLLMAAAVAIGALGLGSVLGGLVNPPVDSSPAPTQAVVDPTDAPSTPVVPATLPSLDALIALVEDGEVIVAQERGPADAPPRWEADILEPPATATFDVAGAPGDVRLLFTCLSHGSGEVRVVGRFPAPIPPIRCDGRVQEVLTDSPRAVSLELTEPGSWRLVAATTDSRAPHGLPVDPPLLVPHDGEDTLLTLDQMHVGAELGPAGPDGRIRLELEGVPARWSYRYSIWCDGPADVQYIHGDEIEGEFIVKSTTQVPCDAAVHAGELGFPEPGGSRVYVAAAPDSIITLEVTSDASPIELVREQPGWQLSAGTGPELDFSTGETSFTGPAGEGVGSLAVAVACAGTEDIQVSVESAIERAGGVVETNGMEFTAACTPDGAVTSASLDVAGLYANVSYTRTAGTWVAVSILVPDPLPQSP